MLLKKFSLQPKNNKIFVAVLTADEKFLEDEISEVWDKMNSQGFDKASCIWGPFKITLQPQQAA